MYAPKKIIFFDFDKKTPRLATRWGGLLSLRRCAYMHQYVGVVGVVGVEVSLVLRCRWCRGVVGELFSINRYVRAINMYVRMKHSTKCKQK